MRAVSHDNSNGTETVQIFVLKESNKTQEEVTWDETAIKNIALPEMMTVRPILSAQKAEEGRKNFNQTMKSRHCPNGRKKDGKWTSEYQPDT